MGLRTAPDIWVRVLNLSLSLAYRATRPMRSARKARATRPTPEELVVV